MKEVVQVFEYLRNDHSLLNGDYATHGRRLSSSRRTKLQRFYELSGFSNNALAVGGLPAPEPSGSKYPRGVPRRAAATVKVPVPIVGRIGSGKTRARAMAV